MSKTFASYQNNVVNLELILLLTLEVRKNTRGGALLSDRHKKFQNFSSSMLEMGAREVREKAVFTPSRHIQPTN